MRKFVFFLSFLLVVAIIMKLSSLDMASKNSEKILTAVTHHNVCDQLGYDHNSRSYKSCVKERAQYDRCMQNNQIGEQPNYSEQESCLTQANLVFPENSLHSTENNQYDFQELSSLRNEFIALCHRELDHIQHHRLQTRQNCKDFLQLTSLMPQHQEEAIVIR